MTNALYIFSNYLFYTYLSNLKVSHINHLSSFNLRYAIKYEFAYILIIIPAVTHSNNVRTVICTLTCGNNKII